MTTRKVVLLSPRLHPQLLPWSRQLQHGHRPEHRAHRPSTRSPPRYPSTSPGTAKVVTVPVLRLEADGRQMSPRAANIRALGTAFNNSSTPCRASPQTAPSTRPGGSPTSSSRGHASVSDGTSQASQSTNLSTDEEGRGKRERRKD